MDTTADSQEYSDLQVLTPVKMTQIEYWAFEVERQNINLSLKKPNKQKTLKPSQYPILKIKIQHEMIASFTDISFVKVENSSSTKHQLKHQLNWTDEFFTG